MMYLFMQNTRQNNLSNCRRHQQKGLFMVRIVMIVTLQVGSTHTGIGQDMDRYG
jgi:hypothetical protein